MKESVLDILIYLFENYMLEDSEEEPDEETIMLELNQAGFNHMSIDHAFEWLENLAIMCEHHEASTKNTGNAPTMLHSMRHLHPYEQDRLDAKAQGLLLSLEQCGVLSPYAREMVIDRLMALDTDEIDLHHIKWVILMVLTNCTDNDVTLDSLTEALVMDGVKNQAH